MAVGDQLAGYRTTGLSVCGGRGWCTAPTICGVGRETRAEGVIGPELAEDPGFWLRFRARPRPRPVCEHRALVTVYGAGEDDGRLYIAMHVRGTTLEDEIARGGPQIPRPGVCRAYCGAGGRCP